MKSIVLAATAAALSFLVLFPRTASSANRTVSNVSCISWPGNNSEVIPVNGNSFTCGIPIGTDFPTSLISIAYFDYYMGAGQKDKATLRLDKWSYTGAGAYTDYVTGGAGGGAGAQYDTELITSNINVSASNWDYLDAEVLGVAWMTGVAIAY